MKENSSYGPGHNRMVNSFKWLWPCPFITCNVSKQLSGVMETSPPIQGEGCLTAIQYCEWIAGTLPDMKILGKQQDRNISSINFSRDMTTKRSIWTFQISQGHGQSYVYMPTWGHLPEDDVIIIYRQIVEALIQHLEYDLLDKYPRTCWHSRKVICNTLENTLL